MYKAKKKLDPQAPPLWIKTLRMCLFFCSKKKKKKKKKERKKEKKKKKESAQKKKKKKNPRPASIESESKK